MSISSGPGALSLFSCLAADPQSSVHVVRRIYEAWSDSTRNAGDQAIKSDEGRPNKAAEAAAETPALKEIPHTGFF